MHGICLPAAGSVGGLAVLASATSVAADACQMERDCQTASAAHRFDRFAVDRRLSDLGLRRCVSAEMSLDLLRWHPAASSSAARVRDE